MKTTYKTKRIGQDPIRYEVTASVTITNEIKTWTETAEYSGDEDDTIADCRKWAKVALLKKCPSWAREEIR